jgi:hypothetical protein
MRRHAAFYLVLGLATALLIVALATGLQTGGSTDSTVWLRAHRHNPLLQMIDLASTFLFVVIGLYGLTVSRLQLQLRHQAEDFGDQMQSLLHRNEELMKVNEEYAEQIAALEIDPAEKSAFSLGDGTQRVVAALQWQVDAHAQQLESIHRTLEQQHNALHGLQERLPPGDQNSAPAQVESPRSLRLAEAVPPVPKPQSTPSQPAAPKKAEPNATEPSVGEPKTAAPDVGGPNAVAPQADALNAAAPPADAPEPEQAEPHRLQERTGSVEATANDGSTLTGTMLDFDVSGFEAPEPAAESAPQAIPLSDPRLYPIGRSFRAGTAGHFSRKREPASEPPPEVEPAEIAANSVSEAVQPTEATASPLDSSPPRTQAAAALDLAESALSSLQTETQEALSSLRAQVEATLPPETAPRPVPAEEPEVSAQPTRRKPWHLRF